MRVILTYLVSGHEARFAKYVLSSEMKGACLPITGPFTKEELVDVEDCEEVVRQFHVEALCVAKRKIKEIVSSISLSGLYSTTELTAWTAVYECACQWLADVINVPVTYRFAVVRLGSENVAYVVHPRIVDESFVFREMIISDTRVGYINADLNMRGGTFTQRLSSPMAEDAKALRAMLADIVERNEYLKEKADNCDILAV